jgi:hypothetical protein
MHTHYGIHGTAKAEIHMGKAFRHTAIMHPQRLPLPCTIYRSHGKLPCAKMTHGKKKVKCRVHFSFCRVSGSDTLS